MSDIFNHEMTTGQKTDVEAISIRSLIPDLENFLTYEGSMTVPGCFETVNWIIINKSLIISRQDVSILSHEITCDIRSYRHDDDRRSARGI